MNKRTLLFVGTFLTLLLSACADPGGDPYLPANEYEQVIITGEVVDTYQIPEVSPVGFVRLIVEEIDSAIVSVGSEVLLKTMDSQTVLLVTGDRVIFSCLLVSKQVERVGLQQTAENLSEAWELIRCFLPSPIVGPQSGR